MLTQEQLELRRTGVGASDIPQIAGLIGSKYRVYASKVGGQEETRSKESLFAMARGNAMEGVIADAVAAERGWELATGETTRHPEHPWMLATPDRIVLSEMGAPLLEIKSVNIHSVPKWKDGLPDHVRAQVQWQLDVCQKLRAYVAADLGGAYPTVYDVYADEEVQTELWQIGMEFWERHVLTQTPPDVDGSAACTEHLRDMFRHATLAGLRESPDAKVWALRYNCARDEEKVASEHKAEAASQLVKLIGEAEGVAFDGGVATRREQRGAVDYQAVARELGACPELLERHRRPSTRVLKVTIKETT
jgi:putative phage-type endonuclease